jgi:hypothetical protein
MSVSDPEERARNREIAQNEEHRKAIGAIRVSSWAIAVTVIMGAIVVGIFWAWTHR